MHTFELVVVDEFVIPEDIVADDDQIVVVHGTEGHVTADFIVQVDVDQGLCFCFFEGPEDELVVWWAGQGQ